MKYLDRLNPGQLEAVRQTEGQVRVVAGPGTGKTRALVARYCHLVAGHGVPPRNILCVTFTNKAADEMKRRVRAILGGDMDLGLVCTFHAFCRLMLRAEIHRLGYPPSFPVMDREDQKDILEKIYGEMSLSPRELTFSQAIDGILETRKMDYGYIEEFLSGDVPRHEGTAGEAGRQDWAGRSGEAGGQDRAGEQDWAGWPGEDGLPGGAGRPGRAGRPGAGGTRTPPRSPFPAKPRLPKRPKERRPPPWDPRLALDIGGMQGAGSAPGAGKTPGILTFRNIASKRITGDPDAPGGGGYRPLEALANRLAQAELPRDDRIFLSSLREQRKSYALDFNDLINFGLLILERFPEVRERWQDRLQYVMVDEFQDVSGKQNRLGEILAAGHGNLFIVGDPDQTIYTWRGSHQRIFLDFPSRHEGARTFLLSLNYRSSPQILSAAGALISRNRDRMENPLQAAAPDGGRPLYFNGRTDAEAARWILSETERLRDSGTPLSEVAVLCRASHMTRAVEEAFFRAKVPCRVLCGVPFYRRREVKAAVSYLRMLVHGDDLAFGRTVNSPRRGLGRKTLDEIRSVAEVEGITLYEALKRIEHLVPSLRRKVWPTYIHPIEDLRARIRSIAPGVPAGGAGEVAGSRAAAGGRPGGFLAADLGDLFQELMDRTGYEESLKAHGDETRLDNLAELKRGIIEFASDPEATLEDFLDRAALYTSMDAEGSRDAVSVMTVHAAKGLEFEAVFVVGLNEALFPSRRCESPEEMEEERRILYVAMTRARRVLRLSSADSVAPGQPARRPSRFLLEMAGELEGARPKDMELLKSLSPPGGPAWEGAWGAPPPRRGPLFSVGDEVVHASFGRGTILAADLRAGAYRIGFDSLSTPRDIMFGADLKKPGKG
ncbi:MAG: UvrD-helicase domain-containing protein [Deltaproteobacteria bacterium]|jgi:DNA helicase-2/ATP-dependent DNA helicase PcrA|nr:UvrD-helicase domain-containing protein [Deltaproteobacteria bacterium]